ncbi:MAG: TatD family hydrolase [Bacilli bacterium]|nr:TatD family hydrolase [Bacilli bacterium]
MFSDTHLHLTNKSGIIPDEFISNASNSNVEFFLASACEPDYFEETISFLDKYRNFYVCLGFHPENFDKEGLSEAMLASLEEKLLFSSKVIALGEIGLDYHWNDSNKEVQIEAFRKQLELAVKLNKPVIIHTRDAINQTYEILKQFNLKGIIHSFSGSYEMAMKFIELGYLIGINGTITFKNSKLYEVVMRLPLDKIVLETDSPYLSPEPFRGKTNESKNIPIIAKKVGDLFGISSEEIGNITTNNFLNLFDLNK